jgi:L-lactate dehydrogenase (cytochrome)
MRLADVGDYRLAARRRLPRFLFEYIDGGSYSEKTLRENVEDLQALSLRQRVMHDVADIDLSTTMLGRPVSMPVALAPIGLAGLYARRGEVQAAKAAEAAGVPFILSTMACCSVEEVAKATTQPICVQLYMIKDRVFMEDLLNRIAAQGVTTLVMTVDLIVHSARYRDVRTGLTGAQTLYDKFTRMVDIVLHQSWAWDVGVFGRPHTLGNVAPAMPEGATLAQFTDWVGRNFDPSLTWKDLDWVRDRWKGQLVIKGVLDREDARAAVDSGVDALVVSNHGGRQLDGAVSSIRILPEIADAVGDRTSLLMDSGVRSGLDVVRALASGADGVLIGRAWAYALAARGGVGVAKVLELIRHEMKVAMALTGQTDVKRLDRSVLYRPPGEQGDEKKTAAPARRPVAVKQ